MQEPSKNTALVTGASGFIGGHLVKRLVNDGWQVKLLVRSLTKISDDLKNSVEIIKGSLTDITALKNAVTNVEVIFHCAAKVDSWGKRKDYWTTNVTGTKNLLQVIAETNPSIHRLVHISTVDVYGFPKQPCDENAPLVQTGFGYGDSKIEGEIYLRSFCIKHNIPFTILRPCNVIGPNSQFIRRISKELQTGLMLTINQGRTNAGIVYIDTLLDYMLWAANNEQALSQCYNIRDNYDVTWAKFIGTLRDILKSQGVILNLPYGVADILSRFVVMFYRCFMPKKEPLLHPLIVRIFGRTCGHSARKIQDASSIHQTINFIDAIAKSVNWKMSEKP